MKVPLQRVAQSAVVLDVVDGAVTQLQDRSQRAIDAVHGVTEVHEPIARLGRRVLSRKECTIRNRCQWYCMSISQSDS